MLGFTELSDDSDGDDGTEIIENTNLNDAVDAEHEANGELGVENEISGDVSGETDTEEVIDEVPEIIIQNSMSGAYHTIGGGFREKSNADNYATKHGGSVLGRFDGLYLVALKSYDSRSDANADLTNIKNISSDAWVFKYSK